MSQIKLSNFVNKISVFLVFSIFFWTNAFCDESIDIWKKQNNQTKQTEDNTEIINNSKIDYSKEDKNLGGASVVISWSPKNILL